jgi:plasmid maintenance system killer protein
MIRSFRSKALRRLSEQGDASGNWPITFGWDGADAVDVDLEDYH